MNIAIKAISSIQYVICSSFYFSSVQMKKYARTFGINLIPIIHKKRSRLR